MFGSRQGYLKGIRSATSFENPGTLALLSTTQAKIGATSGNFPGASVNSAIYSATSARFINGTNPFTIECWYYQTSTTPTFPTRASNDWNTRASFGAQDWVLQSHRNIAGQERRVSFFMGAFSTSVSCLQGTTDLALNNWHHVAVVRTANVGATMATSSINSSGVLTVGTVSAGTISVGLSLTGTGVPANTFISSNISGTGAGSTWQTNTTTTVASTTITGNNFNLYVNGTREAQRSITATTNLDGTATTRRFCIGGFGTSTNSYFVGYIDEFRFSTTGRYFENFTPTTTPFQDDTSTLLLAHFDGANATQSWPDDNT